MKSLLIDRNDEFLVMKAYIDNFNLETNLNWFISLNDC